MKDFVTEDVAQDIFKGQDDMWLLFICSLLVLDPWS